MNDINKNEDVICPKCNSNNIVMQKGYEYNIYGLDGIAIICNKYKKEKVKLKEPTTQIVDSFLLFNCNTFS